MIKDLFYICYLFQIEECKSSKLACKELGRLLETFSFKD